MLEFITELFLTIIKGLIRVAIEEFVGRLILLVTAIVFYYFGIDYLLEQHGYEWNWYWILMSITLIAASGTAYVVWSYNSWKRRKAKNK